MAEDSAGSKIGITFSSFGKNDLIRSEDLIGDASYSGDQFFTVGLTYLHPINKWLFFESGIEYSKHTIVIDPNLPPDIDSEPYKSDFSLINIPLALRANFLRYFFINGGLLIDIDASKESAIDSQTGFGGLLGIGANYDFKCGASIFVNPYIKSHALLPFSAEDNHQRLWESGVRIGLTYNLNRK